MTEKLSERHLKSFWKNKLNFLKQDTAVFGSACPNDKHCHSFFFNCNSWMTSNAEYAHHQDIVETLWQQPCERLWLMLNACEWRLV